MKRSVIIFIFFLGLATLIHAQTNGVLTVSFTTKSAPPTGTLDSNGPGNFGGRHGGGRSYAPSNILAVWVEDNTGKFVKTLIINAARYKTFLTSWKNSTSAVGSTFNSIDAVTGATNNNHGIRTSIWNGTDYNGKLVPDGTYKVCLELTETNSTGNYVSFTFIKGKTSDIKKPVDNTNFSAILLKWEPKGLSISKN
jgi:hypothetical protein